MEIKAVSVYNISHGKLEITNTKRNESHWDIPTTYSVRKSSEKDEYLLSINSLFIRRANNREATLRVNSEFKMKVIGPVIPSTELDYDIYGQLTNIAFSHGRAIFHELTKGGEFGRDYIQLRPHQEFIRMVKEAAFQINN